VFGKESEAPTGAGGFFQPRPLGDQLDEQGIKTFLRMQCS
jgi:hypothetical protein